MNVTLFPSQTYKSEEMTKLAADGSAATSSATSTPPDAVDASQLDREQLINNWYINKKKIEYVNLSEYKAEVIIDENARSRLNYAIHMLIIRTFDFYAQNYLIYYMPPTEFDRIWKQYVEFMDREIEKSIGPTIARLGSQPATSASTSLDKRVKKVAVDLSTVSTLNEAIDIINDTAFTGPGVEGIFSTNEIKGFAQQAFPILYPQYQTTNQGLVSVKLDKVFQQIADFLHQFDRARGDIVKAYQQVISPKKGQEAYSAESIQGFKTEVEKYFNIQVDITDIVKEQEEQKKRFEKNKKYVNPRKVYTPRVSQPRSPPSKASSDFEIIRLGQNQAQTTAPAEIPPEAFQLRKLAPPASVLETPKV